MAVLSQSEASQSLHGVERCCFLIKLVDDMGAPFTLGIFLVLLGMRPLNGSDVSWRAEIGFDPNYADQSGIGLFGGNGSIFSLIGETRFADNIAGLVGGAMSVNENSGVSGSGDPTYARNSVLDSAWAISVLNNCTISWSRKTSFSSNAAGNSDGGALVVQGRSQAFWSGTASFTPRILPLCGSLKRPLREALQVQWGRFTPIKIAQ
ncbi:unnamed protein product [Ascophyllum nodosum]